MPLDPALAALLDSLAAAPPPPPAELTPPELRTLFAAMTQLSSGPPTPPASEDRTIEGPAGGIPIRIYRPGGADEGEGPLAVVVFFHGGGFVIGGIETHDALCQHLSVGVPAVVVSVDYRLAPEHPYPAGLEDCRAATAWVAAHAAELGADPARLVVCGDSAGGNLAAVVSLRARDAGGPPIAYQALIYPVTDLTMSFPSIEENGEGYFLTKAMMGWFADHYLPPARRTEPDASPHFAADVAGLPAGCMVTAEFDPLRDEGEAYAARLREAGVAMETRRYDGMIHGFIGLGTLTPVADRALAELVSAIRAGVA